MRSTRSYIRTNRVDLMDKHEIDALLAELEGDVPAELDDAGPGEPSEDPISHPGDLWILGEHRLLCGDSTKTEDLTRLMAGDTASRNSPRSAISISR